MQTLILKKNEERRVRAGHLWIYSNEVDAQRTPLKNFGRGEIIEIRAANKQLLGIGYINPHTLLCARILTRKAHANIEGAFFVAKIKEALALRQRYFAQPFYRLVFGESDQLPGLVVDRFGDVLVVQCNTAGIDNLKDTILEALSSVIKPRAILLHNNSAVRLIEGLSNYVTAAYGSPPDEVMLIENELSFVTTIKLGQKTGWFYDQRVNRKKIIPYIRNKTVLDLFSYNGAFGITAACNGAKHITCVDSSDLALEYVQKNVMLHNLQERVTSLKGDVFMVLEKMYKAGGKVDVVILDPPAFVKKQKDLNSGLSAYLRLQRLALRVLSPQGILCTTSCSLHLTRDLLLDVLRQAMLKEQRSVTVVEQLHQAPDHPLHPAISETNYLKGFIALVQ